MNDDLMDPRDAPYNCYTVAFCDHGDGLFSLTICDHNGGFADISNVSFGEALVRALEWSHFAGADILMEFEVAE